MFRKYGAVNNSQSALKTRGFSLIEMLVSLTVMATLATIILPSYAEFKKNSSSQFATSALQGVELRQREHFVKKSVWSLDLYIGERLELVSLPSTSPSFVSVYEYADKSLGMAVLAADDTCVYGLVYDPLVGSASIFRSSLLEYGAACSGSEAKQ